MPAQKPVRPPSTAALVLPRVLDDATSRAFDLIKLAVQSLRDTIDQAVVDLFTATASGIVPASGGGTSNFLRADGTWTAPTGAGSVPFFDTVLTPAQLPNAVTDNYNPGTLGQNTLIRVSGALATNPRVGGLIGGVSGKIVAFLNINTSGVIIKTQHEVATSTAANRFTNSAAADLPTDPRSCVIYYYDGITSRWVSLATAKQ